MDDYNTLLLAALHCLCFTSQTFQSVDAHAKLGRLQFQQIVCQAQLDPSSWRVPELTQDALIDYRDLAEDREALAEASLQSLSKVP